MAKMVRISNLNLDGKYQFMPELSEEEYQSLKEDIREWGIQVPPEIDEDYRPLDGWNRIKICQDLGISEVPVVIRDTGMTEEAKIEHAITLNIDRRHITKSQKEDVICRVINMFPNYSFSRLAKITGLSDKTVKKIAERETTTEKWTTSDNSEVVQSEGADGRFRPANEMEAEKQREEIRGTIEEHPDWSNRKIAEEVGVSHSTVNTQRKMAENASEHGNEGLNNEEEYIPEPVRMETEAESLKRALCDEASRLDNILKDVFMNYQSEYAEEARLGLLALSEVIAKYEDIVG